jgi:hypothetical protein
LELRGEVLECWRKIRREEMYALCVGDVAEIEVPYYTVDCQLRSIGTKEGKRLENRKCKGK